MAATRIRAYHARQLPDDQMWTDEVGATLGWRWTPVSAAGLYVPGGLATYPSSVLMNAIPAKVAGVGRLAITVPTPDGAVNPLVLLAAQIAGVDEIYRIGGAQAIAALAYGTETIAPVDKITGPGNASPSQTGSRRNTLSCAWLTLTRWPTRLPTQVRFSSGHGRLRQSVITSAGRTTCCQQHAQLGSLAGYR